MLSNARFSRRHDSRAPTVVFHNGFDNPVFRLKNSGERGFLSVPEFEHDSAAILEIRAGLARQTAVKNQAILASIKRKAGIVAPHFRVQTLDFAAGHIGGISSDEIKFRAGNQGLKSVALTKLDGHAVTPSVFPGDCEGFRGNVHRRYAGRAAMDGQGDCDTAAPGAKIKRLNTLGSL